MYKQLLIRPGCQISSHNLLFSTRSLQQPIYVWVSAVQRMSSTAQLSGINHPQEINKASFYGIFCISLCNSSFLLSDVSDFRQYEHFCLRKVPNLNKLQTEKRDQAVCWMLQASVSELCTLRWCAVPPHFSAASRVHSKQAESTSKVVSGALYWFLLHQM